MVERSLGALSGSKVDLIRDQLHSARPHLVQLMFPTVRASYSRALRLDILACICPSGTTSNAQVLAISRGEQSPRAAHVTWNGMATYGGSSGPSSVEDIFVTGEADFTRSPLPPRKTSISSDRPADPATLLACLGSRMRYGRFNPEGIWHPSAGGREPSTAS